MIQLASKRTAVSEAATLQDYKEYTSKKFCDLNQTVNRPRGELADGSLPTLTTSSGKIYSQDASAAHLVTHCKLLCNNGCHVF